MKRLQTDHVQEWRLHDVRTMDVLDACCAKNGALQALIEAQEQGVIKHISISGHTNPQVQVEAVRRFPFDSALVALSAADHFMYSFAHEFLPIANEKGMGIIGMKVIGNGRLEQWYEQALRYTWSLPISTAILGMSTMEQLDNNLRVANSFVPMTDVEQLEFLKVMLPMANPDVLRWKAKDWSNKEEWAERL